MYKLLNIENSQANTINKFIKDRGHNTILISDFDGTLANFHTDPLKVKPLHGILDTIYELSIKYCSEIIIISGRPIKELIQVLFGTNEIYKKKFFNKKNIHILGDYGNQYYSINQKIIQLNQNSNTYIEQTVDYIKNLLQVKYSKLNNIINYEYKANASVLTLQNATTEQINIFQELYNFLKNDIVNKLSLNINARIDKKNKPYIELILNNCNKGDNIIKYLTKIKTLNNLNKIIIAGDDICDISMFNAVKKLKANANIKDYLSIYVDKNNNINNLKNTYNNTLLQICNIHAYNPLYFHNLLQNILN